MWLQDSTISQTYIYIYLLFPLPVYLQNLDDLVSGHLQVSAQMMPHEKSSLVTQYERVPMASPYPELVTCHIKHIYIYWFLGLSPNTVAYNHRERSLFQAVSCA